MEDYLFQLQSKNNLIYSLCLEILIIIRKCELITFIEKIVNILIN